MSVILILSGADGGRSCGGSSDDDVFEDDYLLIAELLDNLSGDDKTGDDWSAYGGLVAIKQKNFGISLSLSPTLPSTFSTFR